MAFSKLTGKGIDLSTNIITEFNSTGVDDNAAATTITLNANNTATIPNVTGNTTFDEYITVNNLTVNNDASISNDLTVGGNFIITGNTFTVDADSLKVEDSLIHLAGNNVLNDIVDIGFIGHYSNDTGNTELFTGFYRDATDEQYYLFNGLSDDINTATTIDQTGTGYTLAALNVGNLTSTGTVAMAGGSTSANVNFSDNARALFGNGNDLEILHDGNNSYITDVGTGSLYLRGADILLTTAGGTKYVQGGANVLRLYHTGNEKLRTSSTGVVVTGDVTADTVTTNSFTSTGIDDNATSTAITIDASDNVTFVGEIDAGESRFFKPSTFWSSSAAFFGHNYGSLATQGNYDLHLTANGYRNSSGTWTSLAVNSKTGAAQIALDPDGEIGFNTQATKANGDPHTVTRRMTIDADGNVGINTSVISTGPASTLHVHSSVAGAPVPFGSESRVTISTNDLSAGAQGFLGSLFFGGQDVSSTQTAFTGAGLVGYAAGDLAADNITADLLFYTQVGTGAPSEKMRIASSGLVGIGTSIPNRTLTINQTPPTALGSPMLQIGEATFVSGGYYGIGLGYTAASYTNPPTEIAAVSTSSSGGTTADIIFGTRSVTTDTAPTERMRIGSDGHTEFGGNLSIGKNGTTTGSEGGQITLYNNAGDAGQLNIDVAGTANRIFTVRNNEHFLIGGLGGTGHTIKLYTGGSQRVRIDDDGMKFGTDSLAANALDDYEEGTFTPSYSTTGGSFSSITYAYQQGWYTKVGNHVTAGGRIILSAYTQGTASGNVFINLPFTVKAAYFSGTMLPLGGWTSYVPNTCYGNPAVANIYVMASDWGSSSVVSITPAMILSTADVIFTISYTV